MGENMAHFFGQMKGARGETTRCGTASSGLWAHVRGWQSGVQVDAVEMPDGDVMRVYATSGSDGTGQRRLIGEVKRDPSSGAVYWLSYCQGGAALW